MSWRRGAPFNNERSAFDIVICVLGSIQVETERTDVIVVLERQFLLSASCWSDIPLYCNGTILEMYE